MLCAVAVAGWQGNLDPMTKKTIDAGKDAVMTLALPLAGAMATWLGIMRLAEKAGLVQMLARALRPLMKRLFPDVPVDHPAMGSMVMNMAANILGLGNAASPLGLRAMQDLERLNPHPGTATNAMCTFLTINTSSIQLIPVTAISILAVGGSLAPTAIVGSSLLASAVATFVGIVAVKLLERLPAFKLPTTDAGIVNFVTTETPPAEVTEEILTEELPTTKEPSWLPALALFGLFAGGTLLFLRTAHPAWFGFAEPEEFKAQGALVRWVGALSLISVPLLLCGIPLIAASRGVLVYEEFVEGAKEGFAVAIRIIPYLVAMLTAIAMFRASGCIDWLTGALAGPLAMIGFPPELLPMGLMRSLSGSGSMGLFQDLVSTHGPDSLISRMAATIYGSSETTFYVIALYFGSVAIRRTRHAIPAGLIADAAGIVASVFVCRLLFA